MWNLIGALVLAAIGAIVVKKIMDSNQGDLHIPSPGEERFRRQQSRPQQYRTVPTPQINPGFDLSRLVSIFTKLGVSPNEDSAFTHLLYAVENSTFKEVVKIINSKSNTPSDLAAIIASADGVIDEDFEFSQPTGGPYISKEQIQRICREESVSISDDVDQMIKMLIKTKINSGLDMFMQQFDFAFQKFIRKYNNGEDVTEDYSHIKSRFSKLASD